MRAIMVYFFFFQAEDGIRDSSVTGVQTCALPISTRGCRATARPASTTSWRTPPPRRSEERREGKSVDLGGRRIIKKKKKEKKGYREKTYEKIKDKEITKEK